MSICFKQKEYMFLLFEKNNIIHIYNGRNQGGIQSRRI